MIRQSSRLSGSFRGPRPGRGAGVGVAADSHLQDLQGQISELEGDLRAKDQQLLKTQESLREAQEDLARDEVIFAGKVKELQELRGANEQLQAASTKQAARHTQEVEELLLELSKQHAAAQRALPQQGTSNAAAMKKSSMPQQEEEDGSLTPQPPRLTTPVSPNRRPSTQPRGFQTPPVHPPEQTPTPLTDSHTQPEDTLRAERGRSFSNSFQLSRQQAMDMMGMGGGAEEGDQVVIGGVPTRPSSASTTGQSNTWDVDSTAGSITESLQARVGQNPEHAQLLSEHRRLEKGRKELESQALRESRHYSAQQQSLDKQLRECVYNIRNKEDLIAALNKNDLQAKQLSQQYLERLQQLEGQMALKERELQRLKAEAEAIDSDRARTEEEKKKMRAAFEEKVESVQRQLLQLQKQLKEGEAAKKEKARSRQRMKALEDELSRMRSVQDGLSRKIKASNESYEKEAAARQLEVAELRKTGEVHRKRVRALEQEVASQRIIAKRKTDEASVLQKRLHHMALESESGRDKAQAYASSLTPGGSRPRTPGGFRTPGKGEKPSGLSTPHRQAGTPAGGMPRVSMTGGRSHHRQLADVQAVVDKEVSQLLSKQEAEEQVASLQQRKEALQAERDDKQQQRSQLELQLMRFAQRPHSSAVAESQTAERHQIPAEGQSHHGQGGSANSPEKALAARGLQDIAQDSTWPVSPEQLTQEEEEVLRQAAALDDGVDTCQAQLQYLESSLVHCKARVAEAGAAAAQLRQQAESAGTEEVRAMLQKLVGHVVTQKGKARHTAGKAAKLEAALAERTQQMSEAETTLKLKEMEFERRVTSLQKEHAAKVATVLQQAAAVAPGGRGSLQEAAVPAWAQDPSQSSTAGAAGRSADGEQGQDLQKLLKLYKEEREQLSKDVLYYKQSCKDLKRRLKAETSMQSDAGTVLSEVSNQSQSQISLQQQQQQQPGSPTKKDQLLLSGQNIWSSVHTEN